MKQRTSVVVGSAQDDEVWRAGAEGLGVNPEARLAAAVVAHLRAEGWTCYGEVTVPAASKRRADIVATRGEGAAREVWVVECKCSFTWSAIQQIVWWEGWAHYRSLATLPVASCLGARTAALGGMGVGWAIVRDGQAIHLVQPRRDPRQGRVGILLDALRPEHMASRPGNARGEYYTATDETHARLRAVVAARPGVELRAALDAIGLRVTPDERRALARSLARGCVDGVAARRDGRRLYLTKTESVL